MQFVSQGADAGIDILDPNFWDKLMPMTEEVLRDDDVNDDDYDDETQIGRIGTTPIDC